MFFFSYLNEMDKKWLDLPRYSSEYIDGVRYFLDFAYIMGKPQGYEILCPCARCRNIMWQNRGTLFDHLIGYGYVNGYTIWVNHGERVASDIDDDIDMDDEENCYVDDIDGLLHDKFRGVASEKGRVGESPNVDAKKFYNLLEKANEELYPGCKNFSTLSFTIRLYLLKCLHGWSNASFNALLELLKEVMPNLNIPLSFNKTKSMIRDLGLDYKKIDACPNNCMLYWKGHENDSFCYVCGAPRWIENPQVDSEVENPKVMHKVSAKILRYFPLIPRLQRLFMCAKTAELMRWHEEGRMKDGKLRHPADADAWMEFDHRYPDFSFDPRNIRLGLTSDGFNPFRTMSIFYSIWPVILVPYNLPPWLCMKAEYFMLSLIIPGPQSPGVNIDVYLQPLVDDLKLLWEDGVKTYDAFKKENFQLRAALMWTISDFPAYAMLSGWSTKGKLACPSCHFGTNSMYLKHSRKMCYMDHRVHLPMDHAYRYNSRDFNGKKNIGFHHLC